MANIKILNTHKDLNEFGCKYFLRTNEFHTTRITSTELRWLTVRDGNGGFYTTTQEEACTYIKDLAKNFGSAEWDKINMKILLYVDPTKAQHSHIKFLLKCGAEIRYLNETSNTRVIIQDNELYLTFSTSIDKVVNSGVVYIGQKINDPLVNYYIQDFDSKYASARKVMLENEQIVFDKRGFANLMQIIRSYDTKDWLNLVLGAVFGTLFGLCTLLF